MSSCSSCSSNSSSSFMEKMTDSDDSERTAFNDNNGPVTKTVVPYKTLTILESIKQPRKLEISHFITTMAEKKTAKKQNKHPIVRYLTERQNLPDKIIPNNGISSSSTRKRIASVSSANEISIESTPAMAVQEKAPPIKIRKRNDEKSLKYFLDNCDKKGALEMLLADEDIDAKEIYQRYYEKKKISNWDEKDIQGDQVSTIYDINLKNGNANLAAQMTPLQELLVSLYKCFGDNFVDAMLETFDGQFKAVKLLEVLKSDELESAILHKFTADELLNLFCRSATVNNKNQNNQRILEQILELTSPEMIINHVQSTDSLKTSESLLNVLLENFSQIVSEEVNLDFENTSENTVAVNSDSGKAMINGVVNLVKSKKDLKTSECLLNVLLQHGPKTVSVKTKNNIKRFLMKKYSASELNKLLHDVMSSLLTQRI